MNFNPRIEPAPPEWGASTSPGCGARLARMLGELLQTVVVATIIFLAVNLVTARIRVEGSSMEPSLHDGELVVINRLAYRWGAPQRGDIVVFHFPLDPDRRFIKRVIGLPGEHVVVGDGQVTVDGVRLDEPYIAASPRYTGEWEIQPGQLFVLGDNRNNSSDSQTWGAVPLDQLIGKAWLVYWPPPEAGLIPHTGQLAEASG
ncbi:MAG TPA: signal peptidase I [Anaerolineales bacterium]|nr:signal peptidase I [Anaerolineales bacterium]